MELHIVGGHLALDLVNTVAPRGAGGVPRDYLASPEALVEWATLAGVVSAPEAAQTVPSAEELADVLALRDLADEVLAGRQLEALTRRWSEAIGRSRLVPGGLTVGVDATHRIGDRLADALADLVRNADLSRLRACPVDEGGCGWLFLDRSRNLSRKWCTMQDCGTHAKSRRLTERRRSTRG